MDSAGNLCNLILTTLPHLQKASSKNALTPLVRNSTTALTSSVCGFIGSSIALKWTHEALYLKRGLSLLRH